MTGGTHGIGRGIAHVLAQHGASVFVTGRSASAHGESEGRITQLRCDHRHDGEVDAIFERILAAAASVDILVNAVWGGYDEMVEDGVFT